MIPFKLIEFDTGAPADQISGVLSEHQSTLSVTFKVNQGHLFQLPTQVNNPERKLELWHASCFEVFIRPNQGESYVEFNLSPEGHWNAFEFQSYRSPKQDNKEKLKEVIIENPPMMATTGVAREDTPWRLDAQIDLKGLDPQYLQRGNRMIGVSAVLIDMMGQPHYFALSHPATKADFHHPQGHILRL